MHFWVFCQKVDTCCHACQSALFLFGLTLCVSLSRAQHANQFLGAHAFLDQTGYLSQGEAKILENEDAIERRELCGRIRALADVFIDNSRP